LVVRQVWVPDDPGDPRLPIAYVVERYRGVAGAIVIGVAAVAAPATMFLGVGSWAAMLSLLVALAGVGYAAGGRSGFYRVGPTGELVEFLGRRPPDELAGMRRESL
jgi:hypothetical protein